MLNSSTTPSHSSKAFWSRLFPWTSKAPGSKHLERGSGCSLPGPWSIFQTPQCFHSKWVQSSQTFRASSLCLGRFVRLSTSYQNASEMSHFTSNVFFFKYQILGWQKQELIRAIFVFSEKTRGEFWEVEKPACFPEPLPSLPASFLVQILQEVTQNRVPAVADSRTGRLDPCWEHLCWSGTAQEDVG